MPAGASKAKCPMCTVEKRVGDHIKSHILTHTKDIRLYMSRAAIQYTIDNEIPMMCRIADPTKQSKGDYAICLVCKKCKYYGGYGSVYDFYVSHRDCECKDEWETVAPLFNKALQDDEVVNAPQTNANKSSLLMNQMKSLLAEIKSNTAALEVKMFEYASLAEQ